MVKGEEKLKVGDKIIDFGQVYQIFKIESIKTVSDRERIIYFRPFFDKNNNQDLVCTISENSLPMSSIRQPLDEKTVKIILQKLIVPAKSGFIVSFDQARKIIATNDLAAMVDLLRELYSTQAAKEEREFTFSQKRVFNFLVSRVAEEPALVLGQELEVMKEKIKNRLKKAKLAQGN
jgi:RNA polymerase-interacting CarD/CdnL/TRCF family regulator